MKITIDTVKLKEMLNKAVKGAGNSKLAPFMLTELMWIYVKDKTLTLVTTDGTNYLYVKDKGYTSKFDVVVPIEKFNKLIQRITSDSVTLETNGKALTVIGNGTYSIELKLDGDKPVKYNNPIAGIKASNDTINISDVRHILDELKPSLATDMRMPSITNYYVGDKVLATNQHVVSSLAVSLFGGIETLVSPEFMNLLGVITSDTAKYVCEDTYILVESNDCTVYGGKLDGIDDFPAEELDKHLETEFEYSCKVDKNALLAMLDRLSLFVGENDNMSAALNFTADGLEMVTNDGINSEIVEYIKDPDTNVIDFECRVNMTILIPQVKAYGGNVIEIQYGTENLIKFVNVDTVQLICLVNQE